MKIRFARAALLALVLSTLALTAYNEIMQPETPAQRAADACEDQAGRGHEC